VIESFRFIVLGVGFAGGGIEGRGDVGRGYVLPICEDMRDILRK
jgi:hypothetical protein